MVDFATLFYILQVVRSLPVHIPEQVADTELQIREEAQAAQAQCVSLIINTCSFILRNLKWP